WFPVLFNCAGGIEVNFILHQKRAEEADSEIRVQQQVLCVGLGNRRNDSSSELTPVRPERDCGDGEDDHREATEAKGPLDPLEAEEKYDDSEDGGARDEQHFLGPASEQMESD